MKYLTGQEAARMLNISRRSLYRWMSEGRIACTDWTAEAIEAKRQQLQKRKRGPKRNPRSARYVTGRHTFERGLK
jgi:predicted site-specific integrase-resolvase